MAEVGEELSPAVVELLQRLMRALEFAGAGAHLVLQAAPHRLGGLAVLLDLLDHRVEAPGDMVELVAAADGDAVVEPTGLHRLGALEQRIQRPLQAPAQVQAEQHREREGDADHRHRLQPQPFDALLGGGAGDRDCLALALDRAVEQVAQVATVGHVEDLVELAPDRLEAFAVLVRRQRAQLAPQLDEALAEQRADVHQLRGLGRDGDAVALGDVLPGLEMAARHLVQAPHAGIHRVEQALARGVGGTGAHHLLGGPVAQALLVGGEVQQLRQQVAGQAAVARVAVHAHRAQVDEAGLEADQRQHGGQRERESESVHAARF